MKKILNNLFEQKTLSKTEAREVLLNIANAQYNEYQTAAFLTVYLMRSITTEELMGFRDALQELCLKVDLGDNETIDLCGTGGDNKNTFNISTISSFVVAGAGYKVTKHGNYGVSSSCGSSNLMEYFGYKFTTDISRLRREIEECNICFLHAPLFHPAMKTVAPVRRQLGVKTFFNMLGPMVNPAFPKYQIAGVYSLEIARLYNYIYQQSDSEYIIVNSLDGYDEISLTDSFKILRRKSEQILFPEDIGLKSTEPGELTGGNTIADSAEVFLRILQGRGTDAQKNVVLANSGFAINTIEKNKSIGECIEIARESLDSGKAYGIFKKILRPG